MRGVTPEFLADMRQRVEKTAGWLDGYAPGWDRGICKESIDLRTWNMCVLGQIRAWFRIIRPEPLDPLNDILERMFKETGMSFMASGFNVAFGATLDQNDAAKGMWIEEIDKRLAHPVSKNVVAGEDYACQNQENRSQDCGKDQH